MRRTSGFRCATDFTFPKTGIPMIENLLSKFSYDMWVALAILAGLLAWAFAKGRKDPRSKKAPRSREQRETT